MVGTDGISGSIGAHFPAQFGTSSNLLPGNVGFESARSGLAVLLFAARIRHLLVPSYICSAVTEAAETSGVALTRYSIDSDFVPVGVEPAVEGQAILLVDYFGLCRPAVDNALKRLGARRVIIDSSQAYFAPASETALGTIYSLRKFLPVPDGGRVATDLVLPTSPPDEYGSARRLRPYLQRIGTEPENSRRAYLSAESSLSKISNRSMSVLTKTMAHQLNIGEIRSRRISNFDYLSERLDDINLLNLKRDGQTPLCYPMMVDRCGLRKHLIERRIFVPGYWPGVESSNDFEDALLKRSAFLPIDHRYASEDMERIAAVVTDFVKGNSV